MAVDIPVTLETGERSITFSNGVTRVEFLLDPPGYTIINLETGNILLDKVEFMFMVEIEDSGKQLRQTLLPSREFTCMHHELVSSSLAKGRDGGKTAFFHLDAPKAKYTATIAFDLAPGKAALVIRATLTNNNTYSVRMVSMQPLIAGPGSCKVFNDGASEPGHEGDKIVAGNGIVANPGGELVFYNGYQSWSLARSFSLKERQWHAALQVAEWPHHYRYMDGVAWLSRKKGHQVSNSVAVITHPGSKRSITIGFITAMSQHGEIEVTGTVKHGIDEIVATSWCEGKLVRPGGEVSSELIYVQDRNKYPRCLDEYADLVAANMEPVFWNHVPFGFCTWYYYYSNIDEQETLKNLDIVTDKQKNPYFKIDYYQLDDGYQFTKGQCGDWRRVNHDKFPGGFSKLVEAIKEKRLVPGLWIAPFNAMPGSDLAKAHPDWILKNKKGKPITPTFISNKFQYALDLTHPAVKVYLKDLFTYFAHEVGFKYIKIDFVFSAITEDAVFYNDEVTRIEAYREALKILRDAAGEDVFILGCGAPLLESVGFVNGMRISSDTDPHWARALSLQEALGILIPSLRWALLNTITRSWMHKKLWINDPDCLMVRNTGTKLTEDEIHAEISIIGLSGGQVAISDDLALLPAERMRLISLVQPVYPEPAYSPDMFVKPLPELYMIAGSSKIHGTWKVVTVINWHSRKRDMTLDLHAMGCSSTKKYHVFDFWDAKYLGQFKGNETVTLPGVARHGCKLLRVTEDTGSEAVLLGTTLHVLQGALDVEAFEHDCMGKRFHVKLSKHGANKGMLIMKMPGRCLFELAAGAGYEIREMAENVYAILVDFELALDITLKVEMA